MAQKFVLPAILPDGKVKGGLTIREYFAVMVMQGMIASGEEISTTQKVHAHRNEKLAKRAIEVADALIGQLDRSA
jgi:hypothetical protein